MIKLIASDLDGTLLQNGKKEVSDEAISLIRKLKEKGILFVAASGRQYTSLRRLFAPVQDDIAYIAENGALVMYHGEILYKNYIDRKIGQDILQTIRDREGCEIALSGLETLYLQPKTKGYAEHLEKVVKNNVTLVDDILQVKEDYLKISIFEAIGISNSEEFFKEKFGDKVTVVTSGNCWMDMVSKGVNKGTAISMLQQKLGISKEECMAFGDHYNDVEMLMNVGVPYAMNNAQEGVYKLCENHTDTVEDILRTIVGE